MATLSTGPFAVRAVETPSVSNTHIGRNALRKRQTEFTRPTDHGGVASPSLFQTADGRIFALSNGRNAHQFAPGQIFQSSDGRFFTIAAVGSSPAQEPTPKRPSSPVVKSSAPLFQGQSKTNEITDAREKSAAKVNDIRPTLSPTSLPSMIPTTTASTPITKPASSHDLDDIPSTTTPSQKAEIGGLKTQPTSSLKVLSSFKDIFGKRTKPLLQPVGRKTNEASATARREENKRSLCYSQLGGKRLRYSQPECFTRLNCEFLMRSCPVHS